MQVSGITNNVVQNALLSSIHGQGVSKHDLLAASMILHLEHNRKIISESWSRFSENQSQVAHENRRHHEVRRKKTVEQNAHSKRAEERQLHQNLPDFGVHRKAGRARFHPGRQLGESFDHRHLLSRV